MQARYALMVMLVLSQGCGKTLGQPDPRPSSSPSPVPTPTPIPRIMTLDFQGATTGLLPGYFTNVRDEIPSGKYPWLSRGLWMVEDIATGSFNSRGLKQREVRPQPSVTFVRYSGEIFGRPNGELPAKYRAEVTLQAIQSPYNLPPTGDQGTPLCYVDPTHYLEVVLKPDRLEGWECAGGEPEKGEGWIQLFEKPYATKPGDLRRIGAEVDMERQLFTILLNGEKVYQTLVPSMKKDVPHYFALRAIGNEVNYDDIRIERLD